LTKFRTMTAEVFAWSWNLVRWPVIVGLLIIAMALLTIMPPTWSKSGSGLRRARCSRSSTGSSPARGFAFYVNHVGSYNATYGSIGAVIVLLTWM
jgi:membrane protein